MALTTPGSAVLPEDATNTYHKFLEAVQRHGPPHGSTAEDLTNGHSLMADPDARELQYRFADFAGAHLPLLREVLLTGLTISTINRPISFSRITNSRIIEDPLSAPRGGPGSIPGLSRFEAQSASGENQCSGCAKGILTHRVREFRGVR
jgi:hypothetical protein